MSLWLNISEHISSVVGKPFVIRDRQALGGGCINQAYRLSSAEQHYFVKLNDAARLAMFEAEASGLREMAEASGLTVPLPVCSGSSEGHAYLVLQYLALRSAGEAAMAALGAGLARMHQRQQPYFGWHRDNTIGATAQSNRRCGDWVAFWREHRLGYQLALAARNGYTGGLQQRGERLLVDLDRFFDNYTPVPCLLHGDLWAGNAASDEQGNPVVFDPAAYYGDREADLAMTELFGGFSPRFYDTYRAVYPLDQGYALRRTLYQLYHVLNHLNLFGAAYLGQAQRMIDELLLE